MNWNRSTNEEADLLLKPLPDDLPTTNWACTLLNCVCRVLEDTD